jgi:ATP-dependent exoDNAse (exonuclease V) beta subunit
LLKLDFEPKVNETIRRNFRQTVNQTLKTHLLPLADRLANDILQQYDRARDTLQLNLEQEAAEKIQRNQRSRQELQQKIEVYNTVVGGINVCLESMDLVDRVLPLIS